MTTNPINHSLPAATKARITALYQAGKSLPEIVKETGVRYSLVYFYTVSGGKLSGPEQMQLKPIGCDQCKAAPYAVGLCFTCYYRQWQRQRRRLKK